MEANLSEIIRLRCSPKFRDAVFAAAEAREVTVSALVRSQLAAAVEQRSPVPQEVGDLTAAADIPFAKVTTRDLRAALAPRRAPPEDQGSPPRDLAEGAG